MFSKNPDGAGFAIQGDIDGDGGFKVKYEKGFMNVEDFIEALGPRERLKDFTVAMHFRIKTSGNIDPGTCHPFLMSSNYFDLRKTSGTGAVLFHNGVFSGLGGVINENASDTQDYVVGVAMKYLKNAKTPHKIAQKVVENITGLNRILILYPKPTYPIFRLGTWYEHKGILYSNMGYYDEEEEKRREERAKNWKTHSAFPATSKYFEIDDWGCQIAPEGSPGVQGWWRCQSKERWDTVMKYQAQERQEREGLDTCKFAITGEEIWFLDEDRLEAFTAEREQDVLERDDQELYMEQTGLDASEEYLTFYDEDELEEWMLVSTKINDYTYKYNGKIFYVDTINLEAFTEQGIKMLFKTGEQGHVKKDLEKKGMLLNYHPNRARFEGPTDDEEDDEEEAYYEALRLMKEEE